ncbi:hypothetical protein B566_EDAN016470 [Ephemera danica]|nr:hypothetical protein B566_EDAN016470 [Ephemera danica]
MVHSKKMSTEDDLWTKLEKDEFLNVFLHGKYDVTLHEQISRGLAVSEQLAKLTEGISLLDKELQHQVTDHYEDLLSQATWIEKLEGVLNIMQSHIQCLLSAVERLRGKIVEPFTKVQTQTKMLVRLHNTCDMLRRIIRVSQLSRRLQAHMQIDVDMTGIDILQEDQQRSRQLRAEVERQARQQLQQGLAAQNLAQVETALQVFQNLGVLQDTIEGSLSAAKLRVSASVREELDVHVLTQPTTVQPQRAKGGPGRASMVTPGNSAAFRTNFWSATERLLERVSSEARQAELLRRHLASTPAQRLPAALLVQCAEFWPQATQILGQELLSASQGSTFIQQALEGEYPKFLRLYLEMCSRLQAWNDQLAPTPLLLGAEESEGAITNPQYSINRQVIQVFENAYLSRSMSRLFDPVNLMFGGDALPSLEEVDNLMRTVTSELSVSLVDPQLSRTVANNVGNTIKLFCAKCEHQVVTGGEATQVIEPPSPGQLLNAGLVGLLHHLDTQVRRRAANIASLPPEASSLVLTALDSAWSLAASILKPLLASVADAVEAILLTMHGEDFSQELPDGQEGKPEAPCSLYMRELQGFLSRVATTYLSHFSWPEVTLECVKPVAERCLELFVRLACLVRPLGELGRLKLAADFAQMELAVASLCRPSELGRAYRAMRSLKPLLFQTPEDIAKCPALGEALPRSAVLTLLFSRGPQELLSPHQSAGWSVSRYCQWLDEHTTERERLELIGGALQRYQKAVSVRGETHFHPVYPTMVQILEAA